MECSIGPESCWCLTQPALCCPVLCCRKDYAFAAAVAICLGGGYKDDHDTGAMFTYTGAGGQEGKKQVSTG